MYTSISIDKVTRDCAAKRAHAERIPLAMVVRVLLMDYAQGNISIGTRTRQETVAKHVPVDKKTQEKMDAITREWHGRVDA